MPDTLPCLSCMSLDQVEKLSIFLADLARAGSAVETYVEFDLTPGQAVVMRMPDMVMPGVLAPVAAEAPRLKPLEETLADMLRQQQARAKAKAEPVTIDGEPVKIDVKAFVDDVMAEIDAPKPAAAPASDKPAPWTPEEDARAVALMAEHLMAGAKKGDAYCAVADALGRPLEGFKFRCKTKLGDQIDLAVAQLSVAQADPDFDADPGPVAIDPPETSYPDPQPIEPAAVATPGGGEGAAAGGHEAPAATDDAPEAFAAGGDADPGRDSAGQGLSSSLPLPRAPIPAELREVVAHLREVTPFGKFTPQLDRDMLDLAEELRWPMGEICLELRISSQQAQARLSTLTKAGAFKRAQVHAAMVAMGYGKAEPQAGAA